MREVSQSEFMEYAVSELSPEIYAAWKGGMFGAVIDMNNLLMICIRKLLIDGVTAGSIYDYIRDIAIVDFHSALRWVS